MSLANELSEWGYEQRGAKAVEALGQNGFTAHYVKTAAEAAEYVLKHGEEALSVGFGGSMTIVGLKVEEKLRQAGKEILNHGAPGLDPSQKLEIRRRQLTCDLFLSSVNAVTLSGLLVNIDGSGNRVAALTFGPKKVIVVVGRNKLVDGDLDAAIHRVKNVASPPNARRLNFNTPCARTGFCANCNSPERICRVISVMERKPAGADFHVLVVNEDLGF